MICLERLELHGFKQFAGKEEFEFLDKINVITGPNEAGKSTILDAILIALFGCKPTDKDTYCSWGNGDICTVELEFSIDDDKYKIKRDIRNDKSGLLKKSGNEFREISGNKTKIADFVDRCFGFKELRVFSNTLVIGQNDLTILKPKTTAEKTTFSKLKQMIEISTSGSKDEDSSLSKIIANVNNMHGNLVSPNRRGAQIPRIEKAIEDVNLKLNDVRVKKQNHSKNMKDEARLGNELAVKKKRLNSLGNRKKLYDAKERIEENDKQLKNDNEKGRKYLEQITTLEKDISDAKAKVETLELKYKNITDETERRIHSLTVSCNEAKERIETKQKILKKEQDIFNRKNEEKNQYNGFDTYSEADIHSIVSKIDRWKKVCSQLEQHPRTVSSSSRKRYVITLLLIGAGAIGGVTFGNLLAGIIVGIVLGIISYQILNTKSTDGPDERQMTEKNDYETEFSTIKLNISSFDPHTFYDTSKNYIEILRDMEVLNTKIKQLEDDIASEESILESKSEKLSDIIHEIPDYSYSNFKLEFMQLKKYRVTIREKNEALNNLLANSSKEEVEDLLRMNASELLKLDVEWNKLKLDYVSFSDDEINEIVHIDALSEEVREIERHYTETLGRVKESSNSGVNDLVLEEELESLLDEKEKLEYKACVLEILMKYLDETDKDIKTRFAPQVAEKMTPWLSRITSNRYSTISLNADLELSVNVPDIDSFVDIGALSRGTQDQIYLGLRIVIGDLISGERNVPIFLDDTMHTFDSVRLTSVKTMFDEISHERQIFLFSHNDAYKDWGEQGAIIEL